MPARVPLDISCPPDLSSGSPGRFIDTGCAGDRRRGERPVGVEEVLVVDQPRTPPQPARVASPARMAAPLPQSVLDTILAHQLTVAWAGEGRCEPRRLGWWDTDLVDEAGGGDFFRRLLPRTRAWASLEAVREAARRVDAKARRKMADPDRMRTLFFLGFEVDELVGERLAALKREGRPPAEALPFPVGFDARFSTQVLETALRRPGADAAACRIVPGGRHLKGAYPASPGSVRQLAAALPLADQYPLPFFGVAVTDTLARARETTEVHTRILRLALGIEESRAWPASTRRCRRRRAIVAFEQRWYGAKSLERVRRCTPTSLRYDAFPAALAVLRGWPAMALPVRQVLCHFHLQLTDPIYRHFTGGFLVERRQAPNPRLDRDVVLRWVRDEYGVRWASPRLSSSPASSCRPRRRRGSSRQSATPATSSRPRCPTSRSPTSCTCSAASSSPARSPRTPTSRPLVSPVRSSTSACARCRVYRSDAWGR